MKNKDYPDNILKFLLKEYSPPEFPDQKVEDNISKLESFYKDNTAQQEKKKRFRWRPALSFAALFLLLVTSLSAIYLFLALPEKIIITGNTGFVKTRIRRGQFQTAVDENILIEAGFGTLRLLPETNMHVGGLEHNKYTLKSGTVIIKHTSGASKTAFSLQTPVGELKPLGTHFMASYLDGILRIFIREGSVSFYDNTLLTRIIAARGNFYKKQGAGALLVPGEPDTREFIEFDEPHETAQPLLTPLPSPVLPDLINSQGPSVPETPVPVKPVLLSLWDVELVFADYLDLLAGDKYLVAVTAEKLWWYASDTGELAAEITAPVELLAWVIYRDVVYVYGANNFLYAYSPGVENWQRQSGALAYGAASLHVSDQFIYLPSTDKKLYIYKRSDGTAYSSIKVEAGLYGQPLEVDNRVIFSTYSRKVYSYELAGPALHWDSEMPEIFTGDKPLLWEGNVVLQAKSGTIYALDIMDGSWVSLGQKIPGAGLLAVGERLYLGGSGGLSWFTLQAEENHIPIENTKKLVLYSMGSGNPLLVVCDREIYTLSQGMSLLITSAEEILHSAGTGTVIYLLTADGTLRKMELKSQ